MKNKIDSIIINRDYFSDICLQKFLMVSIHNPEMFEVVLEKLRAAAEIR